MNPRPIRVLVAEGDPVSRRSLLDLVAREDGLELAGTASSVDGALAVTREAAVDVALVAIEIDGGSGARLVRILRHENPVLAYAATTNRDDVVGMLRAGAVGYLTRDSTAEEIVAALLATAAGQATISPAAAPAVVQELADHLTAQERILDEERARLARVREVLDDELIDTVFQPIVAVDTRKVDGYEALARVRRAPIHPPDRWFAEAWQVGLGPELEILAIRVALSYLDRIPEAAYMAVNVSPDVIAGGGLRGVIGGVDGERVVVEMTEHAAVDDYDRLADALATMRAAGTKVSVDDAGAGFASLRHILRLEPDYIKLDGSITHEIDKDLARHALARGLVSFAGDINAHIIGEGVETDAELEALRRLGVASAQGYLFGHPGPLPPRT